MTSDKSEINAYSILESKIIHFQTLLGTCQKEIKINLLVTKDYETMSSIDGSRDSDYYYMVLKIFIDISKFYLSCITKKTGKPDWLSIFSKIKECRALKTTHFNFLNGSIPASILVRDQKTLPLAQEFIALSRTIIELLKPNIWELNFLDKSIMKEIYDSIILQQKEIKAYQSNISQQKLIMSQESDAPTLQKDANLQQPQEESTEKKEELVGFKEYFELDPSRIRSSYSLLKKNGIDDSKLFTDKLLDIEKFSQEVIKRKNEILQQQLELLKGYNLSNFIKHRSSFVAIAKSLNYSSDTMTAYKDIVNKMTLIVDMINFAKNLPNNYDDWTPDKFKQLHKNITINILKIQQNNIYESLYHALERQVDKEEFASSFNHLKTKCSEIQLEKEKKHNIKKMQLTLHHYITSRNKNYYLKDNLFSKDKRDRVGYINSLNSLLDEYLHDTTNINLIKIKKTISQGMMSMSPRRYVSDESLICKLAKVDDMLDSLVPICALEEQNGQNVKNIKQLFSIEGSWSKHSRKLRNMYFRAQTTLETTWLDNYNSINQALIEYEVEPNQNNYQTLEKAIRQAKTINYSSNSVLNALMNYLPEFNTINNGDTPTTSTK